MHIPSDRVFKEMQATSASIWYVPSNGVNDVALLIKSLTPAIKAIIGGCQICLLFGKEQNCLCIGIKTHDIPEHPLIICRIQRNKEEYDALYKCLINRRFPVFLYNEMNVCVAWSFFVVTEDIARQAMDFVSGIDNQFNETDDSEISKILDNFEIAIEKNIAINETNMQTFFLWPQPEKWHNITSFFLSNNDYKSINICDKDEGDDFEKTIWSSLAYMFPDHIYKGPKILIGNNEREFTDVFSFYDWGSFIIETKALSVISTGYNRTMERRNSGIKKQVSKAIKQLVGAVKHFKSGNELLDNNGNIIEVSRDKIPHCIIMVSELDEYCNWDDIVKQLLKAFISTGAFFHLLDERELISLLIGSSNDPAIFDYNLIERFKLFVETQNIKIRSQL